MTTVATTVERLVEAAGFDFTGSCAAGELAVHEEVRESCAEGKCHVYNTSWACPPACGDIHDFERQMHAYAQCAVLQTVGQMEDEFDGEAIMETGALQRERIYGLVEALVAAGLGSEAMVLSAGTCEICPTCSYPDAPCRFPDKRLVSMEAAGLIVAEVCTAAGVPYNHGPRTISFTGCVLYG